MPKSPTRAELTKPKKDKDTLYCNFCGRSQFEVQKLIAGPAVFICDECVVLCLAIIGEDPAVSMPDIARVLAENNRLRQAARDIIGITKHILKLEGNWHSPFESLAVRLGEYESILHPPAPTSGSAKIEGEPSSGADI